MSKIVSVSLFILAAIIGVSIATSFIEHLGKSTETVDKKDPEKLYKAAYVQGCTTESKNQNISDDQAIVYCECAWNEMKAYSGSYDQIVTVYNGMTEDEYMRVLQPCINGLING